MNEGDVFTAEVDLRHETFDNFGFSSTLDNLADRTANLGGRQIKYHFKTSTNDLFDFYLAL